MVRPPHLPPIGDEEAKRKWKMMNRPSISRQFFGPKKRTINQENYYIPVSNPHTYNNQHRNSNRRTYNNQNNNDYQGFGSIIMYIFLAIIAIALLLVFWWILMPIAIIYVIYKIASD